MHNSAESVSSHDISNAFRPVPFWSWNDTLQPDELIRQIHDMHDAGMGGFFMHARTGLATHYLGPEWMAAVSQCVREAEKLGMDAWLYDENGWPSGFGAGAVNALGEEYWQKTLRFGNADGVPQDAARRVVAWFDAENRLLADGRGAATAAWYDVNPFYVDNMSPQVTGAFIEHVHEVYWRELPDDVRQNLTGIFTDEPQLATDGIPWSPILPDEYQTAYGEPLLPRLPELFSAGATCRRTRIRLYRLCAQLFRKNYICRLGDWCRAHGWKLTGHNVMEEMLHGQVYTSGDVMPQYTGYSIPGIDHLDRYSPYTTSEIQVVSVAAQTGKHQILTETFGCTGWNFNMQGMKWMYQQQLAHGVNLLCQHLAGYSLHGLRKRDYPASLFYQHPSWPIVKTLYDAFARVGRMLATGKIQCDLLVIHGISSAWTDAIGDNRFGGTAQQCYEDLTDVSKDLDDNTIPFHYGDEILMEEMATVTGDTLHVGEMAYSTVVIPMLTNISAKVLALVKAFHGNGGMVLARKNTAQTLAFVDGMPISGQDKAFLESLPAFTPFENLAAALAKRVRHIVVKNITTDEKRIHATWRAFPDRAEHWYYIADTAATAEKKADDPICRWQYLQGPADDEPAIDIQVWLPFPAREVRLIDQTTGDVIRALDIVDDHGSTCFLQHLPACGSLLLQAIDKPAHQDSLAITDGWTWTGGTNVLSLDRAQYKTTDMGGFSPELDTLAIFNRMLSIPDTDVTLRFAFTCADALDFNAAQLQLALEPADGARYSLNGIPLTPDFDGWFIDRSIRCMALPQYALRYGENTLEITWHFSQSEDIRASLEKAKHFESEANKLHFDSELEAIYLLGRFACTGKSLQTAQPPFGRHADGPFTLEKPRESYSAADMIGQGFPFFSGYLTLTRTIDLTPDQARRMASLVLTPFRADSAAIAVNGTALPPVFAPPYQCDIRGLLHAGTNHLALTLGIAPRNTMGPLHTLQPEPDGIRPTSFLTEPDILNRQPRGDMTTAYSLIEPGIGKITLN